MSESSSLLLASGAFEAYRELKRISKEYDLEDELEVPQLVVVGETSAGKSMLVQNFLGFPCSFTSADIATRCPVAYRLVHNSDIPEGEVRVVRPENIGDRSKLADHLQQVMEQVKRKETTGFSKEPYQVELESAAYTDFEILDVPGFVTGNPDASTRQAVEDLVEVYVRNPRFAIVLVKETNQLRHNATGALRVHELCTMERGKATKLPPRPNYRSNMITIHTKFDGLMATKNTTDVNTRIRTLKEEFGETYFVNMIFDGYSMSNKKFDENVNYILNLPDMEKTRVDNWIEEMNRMPESAASGEKFKKEYRPLIGIEVVRTQIQQLWLKSFCAAIPKLKEVLNKRYDLTYQTYKETIKLYEYHDPEKVRRSYLEYIDDFEVDIRRYASYKSEIINFFPTEFCGKTYKEIEENCRTSWSRYIPLTWRAYKTIDELSEELDGRLEIDAKLVGVRHFQRLNQIFHYLVYSYQPDNITEDDILSACGLLYGGLETYENLQKAVREWLRKIILDTFTVGIAWLAQMYTYLLDLFRQDVKNFLLSPGRHHHLAKHFVFLNAMDREFHYMVRPWRQRVIQALRYKCESIGEYAHYDLTARLKMLIFSIPATIEHKAFKAEVPQLTFRIETTHVSKNGGVDIRSIFRSIRSPDIFDHIYSSESYLTEDRDPKTLNHHGNGREVIRELYRASCGSIMLEVMSNFNSSIVTRIQQYGTMRPFYKKESKRSLRYRIIRMSKNQLNDIANLDVSIVVRKIVQLEEKLGDLFAGRKLIEQAEKAMDSISNTNRQNISRKSPEEIAREHLMWLQEETNWIPRNDDEAVIDANDAAVHSSNNIDDPNQVSQNNYQEKEEDRMMGIKDETMLKMSMSKFYRDHDGEDLALGLESKESLKQDEADPALLAHLFLDPDTMDYTTATGKASLAQSRLPPSGHDPYF